MLGKITSDVHTHLRSQKKRRKRYGSARQRRGQIVNRRGIETRPLAVEAHQHIGDWEADTVLGTQASVALVTLTERVTRLTLVAKVAARTADAVRDAIIRLLTPLKALVNTITFDNGKEFAGHETIAKALSADCYFADPYASWQRGLIKYPKSNFTAHNPLISKAADFRKVTYSALP